MSGELCFTGTRVPVKMLFGWLASGESLATFLGDFPTVKREQAMALINASQTLVQTEELASA